MSEEKSLKSLVDQMFSTYGMTKEYDQAKVVNAWEEIVGKAISRKTTKLYINGSVMYLFLSSAPLKNELSYHKSVLIEKINAFAKKELITDIQLY